MNPFAPTGATVSRAATSTTASVAITSAALGQGGTCVRLHNIGPNIAFVKFGVSGVEAAATDLPIPVGVVEVFAIGPLVTHMAAICASGQTATVYCTPGQGI